MYPICDRLLDFNPCGSAERQWSCSSFFGRDLTVIFPEFCRGTRGGSVPSSVLRLGKQDFILPDERLDENSNMSPQ